MKKTLKRERDLSDVSPHRGKPPASGRHKTVENKDPLTFTDLFNPNDIKKFQSTLHEAFNVASVILDRQGRPVTDYIGFSGILDTVARNDGLTFLNCMSPALVTLKPSVDSPDIIQCPQCGLLYGSVPIMAGNHHIATWLIGQVLDEDADIELILDVANRIGIDRTEYKRALSGVPRMKRKRFEKICEAASVMANNLSILARKNLVQARDIVALKKAEEAARASELRYRQMFNNNPFPSIVYDVRTLAIVDVNDIAIAHYGYSREEFLAKTINDLQYPQAATAHTGEAYMGPSRHIKKDGAVIDVEVTGHVLDFPGKTYRIITVIDITSRKETEERLKFTQAVVERVVDAIFWLDDRARIVYANDAACKLTGYTRDELLSMTILDIDPYLTDDLWQRHWELKKAAGSLLFEAQHRKKNGTLYPVEVSASYVVYNNKEYNCTFSRDITERKKVEEQLRLTRFTVDRSAAIIIWVSEDSRILYANHEACRTLQYSRNELLQLSVFDINPAFPEDVWKKHWQDVKEQGNVIFESRHKRKDGTFYPVEIKGNYIQYGNIGYICSIAFDITERKKTEELLISERERADEEKKRLQAQLLQSQKMEAIGQLAGGIAHDFNNILTAIIGYGNILEMEIAQDNPLRAYVEEILTSSEKASNLTQSLLSFSRKQQIKLAHHDINDIIRGVEKLLKRLLSEDIELKISFAPNGMIVMADITQLQQVLINLATNARDAMPSGGMLSIVAEAGRPDDSFLTSRTGATASAYVKLSVSDTGHGMDETVRERIFDPFFTTKEVGKGTGLGLSIVYGIVKQHGGYITVYSERKNGTTFHIYLPIIEEKTADLQPTQREFKRGSGTILLAEDNPQVRRLAKDVLMRTGYDVIEAADGQEAVDSFLANHNSIDLVIIDVVMPRKNGREAIDEIRLMNPQAKVLFTSGYTRDILSDKGMADIDFNFLAKPLSPQELLEKVQDIMES